MKRILLLLVFLFLGFNSAIAQKYKVEIKKIGILPTVKDKVCRAFVDIRVEFYEDTTYAVIFSGNYYDLVRDEDISKEFNKKIKAIHYSYSVLEGDGYAMCLDQYSYYKSGVINISGCAAGIFSRSRENEPTGQPQKLNFSFGYNVFPIIEIDQFDDNMGYNKWIKLGVKKNSTMYSTEVYNWQYLIEGETWRPMPTSTKGKKSFNIIPKKFLEADGFSPEEVINKEILFRISTCALNLSEAVAYTIRKAAPSIDSTKTFPPSCYGDKDAKIRVYFDRQIDPGEKISYVLYNKDKYTEILPSGDTLYVPVKNVNNLTAFKESNGQYYLDLTQIPPSENYKFEIIGIDKNPDNDAVYDELDLEDSGYGGASLYTGDGTYSIDNITIPKTPPVKFTVEHVQDITCHGTVDGKIILSATGGSTGAYQYQMRDKGGVLIKDWTDFTSGDTLTIAQPGTYSITVMDSNGCKAFKINAEGQVDMSTLAKKKFTIEEPEPLLVSVIGSGETKNPTAHGFKNGIIAIEIQGGNHNNSPYEVTWFKNGAQMDSTSIHTEAVLTGEDSTFTYVERLIGVGAGKYTVTVWDSSEKCKTTLNYELAEPDSLAVDLRIATPISCNTANDGKNSSKSKDGRLKAIASGGVAPYEFTWKKKNKNGEWKNLTGAIQTDSMSVLSGLAPGIYSVNIKDANGIVMGLYKNDSTLLEARPVKIKLEAPAPLVINVEKEDVFCKGGENAWIEMKVSGGTYDSIKNYQYQWKRIGSQTGWSDSLSMEKNNSLWLAKIEHLAAGDFELKVIDSKGCFAVDTVIIDEPEAALKIEQASYKQPSAPGFTDGYIQYKITGGTPKQDGTYTYEWMDENGAHLNAKVTDSLGTDSLGTDAYFIKLNNIGKGTYALTVTDANYSKATGGNDTITDNNAACVVTAEFTLEELAPLRVSIEQTKVISCNADNVYNNPFSNGELTAHASGGEWLQPTENNGYNYYYTWKKKTPKGEWKVLKNQKDSVASGLSAGVYAVNIEDANGIVLGIYGSDNKRIKIIDSLFTLKQPPLLEISTTQQNVYCYNGSDARATVHITGGIPPYAIEWSTGDRTKTITGLSAGTYDVYVTDSRGCEAIAEVKITAPEVPVTIAYSQYNRPSSIGATDAWIEAVVTGGTPFEDGTYTYFWQDEAGSILNAQTSAAVVNGKYVIRLENISAGNYFLTVRDKNYEIAEDKPGCTHADSKFSIYEPIEAVIEIKTPISCHSDNEYQDAYSDGALVAHVTGGVPFDSGRPYIFHWKKQNASGQWEDLPTQTGNIAVNLAEGNYALNVEDSRGTVMGIYNGDELVKAIPSTFYLPEPALLEMRFTTSPISCDAGNNGTAEVFISGGTPPYKIKWSNGETTPKINNLIAGTYFVFVTDSRGCQATGTVSLTQPSGLSLEVVTQKKPTCNGGTDGVISIQAGGGVPPYTYQWENGGKNNSRSGLPKGTYTLKVTDSQGCIAYKKVVLEDPKPVVVNLGGDITLCQDQEFSWDISIDDPGATYLWTSNNGFTSNAAQVTLREAGIYTAKVTTSLGCVGQDQVRITTNNSPIDADFLITSQAFVGEEVVIVNVSEPLGEETQWFVPEGVTIVSQSNEAIILKFGETGAYEIRLRTREGNCYQDYTKKIVVKKPSELYNKGGNEEQFLKTFKVYPNPSSGRFKVEIQLSEPADVALRLISLLTATVSDTRRLMNSDEYVEPYKVAIPSGTYILLLETPRGKAMRRVIIE